MQSTTTAPAGRAPHRAVGVVVAVTLLTTCFSVLASDPPPDSASQPATRAPSPDSEGASRPAPTPPAKESDQELMKKRMQICQRRPEACVQQSDKDRKDADARPPAADQADK
jgi:hypothetical protein